MWIFLAANVQLYVSLKDPQNDEIIVEFSILPILSAPVDRSLFNFFCCALARAGFVRKNRIPFQVFTCTFWNQRKKHTHTIHRPLLSAYFTLFDFIVEVCYLFPSMLCWSLLFGQIEWIHFGSHCEMWQDSIYCYFGIFKASLFSVRDRKTQPFKCQCEYAMMHHEFSLWGWVESSAHNKVAFRS